MMVLRSWLRMVLLRSLMNGMRTISCKPIPSRGIKMHDGTELNADDVIFCLEKYLTSKEYASVDFENTKALDDYTVYFKLLSSGTSVG